MKDLLKCVCVWPQDPEVGQLREKVGEMEAMQERDKEVLAVKEELVVELRNELERARDKVRPLIPQQISARPVVAGMET
jgi:hypothetical protein